MSTASLEQWVIDCELELTSVSVPHAYHGPTCIFSAPKELLKEAEDAYVPRAVSIGPYHFREEKLKEMERFKGDAAYRQLVRIRNRTGNPDFSFHQLIHKFSDKLGQILPCYDKVIHYDAKVVCWMMARDAWFILEFLRSYICQVKEIDRSIDEGFELDEPLHPIFGLISRNHVVKAEIMRDLIKLENQIPLCVLEDALAMEQVLAPDEVVPTEEVGVYTNQVLVATEEFLAIERLVASQEASFVDRLIEAGPRLRKVWERLSHIKDLEKAREKLKEAKDKLKEAWEKAYHVRKVEKAKPKLQMLLKAVFRYIYYRPFDYFPNEDSPWKNHILDIYYYYCLREGYVNGPLTLQESNKVEEALKRWKFPSAVDLKNGGVRIQSNDDRKIPDIRFDGRTLFIPPIKFDVDSEIFIRNLIALEICSPYLVLKSLTEYVQFLDELCETEKGVRMMVEKKIVIGNLRHPSQVVRLLNLSSRVAFQPTSISPALKSRADLVMYSDKKRITVVAKWNEFRNSYGSKPWLVVGGLGATTILCLTAIQVHCLYHHCGPP